MNPRVFLRLIAGLVCVALLSVGCARLLRRKGLTPTTRLIADVSFSEIPVPDTGPDMSHYWVLLPMVRTAPTVDGNLTEACWKTAATLDGFVMPQTSIPKLLEAVGPEVHITLPRNKAGDYMLPEPTVVKACADKRAVYLGARCVDGQKVLDASSPEDIPRLDDCIQFLIDTRRNLFRISVNCAGKRYDEHLASTEGAVKKDQWFPSITSRTNSDEKGWCWEAAIPFTSLDEKYPRTGDFYQINVARHNKPPLKIGGYPLERMATWVPVRRSLTELDRLGRGFFYSYPGVCILRLDAGVGGIGHNSADVSIRNLTSKPERVRLFLSTLDEDEKRKETVSKWVSLGPGESRVEKMTYLVPRGMKSSCLHAFITDEKEKSTFSSEFLPFDPPQKLMEIQTEEEAVQSETRLIPMLIQLNIGDISLPDYKIVFKVLRPTADRGLVAEDEIPAPQSRLINVNLSVAGLPPGDYELVIELERDRSKHQTVRRPFRLR